MLLLLASTFLLTVAGKDVYCGSNSGCCGQSNEYLMCPDGHAVTEYCGSGRQDDCCKEYSASPATCTGVKKAGEGKCKTYIRCSPISSFMAGVNTSSPAQIREARLRKSGQAALPIAASSISWQCATAGTELKCSHGAMVGVCGSGSYNYCTDPSKGKSGSHCLGCALVQGGQVQESDDDWEGGNYNTASCPKGKVACGECSSGKDKNCYGYFARVRCCSIGKTVTPAHRRGYWQYVPDGFVSSGETKTISITIGTSFGSTKSTQSSWGDTLATTFSESFEADCLFCKVEASFSVTNTVSREIVKTYQTEFKKTVTSTNTESYTGPCKLWQWVFDAEWPGGAGSPPQGTVSDTFTTDKICTNDANLSIPCCFPAECNRDNCQTCSDMGYGGHNLCKKSNQFIV